MAYQFIEDLVCKGSIRASQVLPLPIHLQLLCRQLHSSDSLPQQHGGAHMTLVIMVWGDASDAGHSYLARAL